MSLDRSAAGYPPFVARAPWWGADLQTVRNVLAGRGPRLEGWPAEELLLRMQDGSGDRLVARLHLPIPDPSGGRSSEPAPNAEPVAPALPTVILVHGLGGDENSHYVRVSTAFWLARSHPVLRLNLRGAGPSRQTCRLQYHAGRSADLRDALAAFAALRPHLASSGVVLVGYSLGGNLVLKLLGELAAAGSACVAIRAAAAISAPIDLEAASRRFLAPRNRLYHWSMLRRLKEEATAAGAHLERGEREAIAASRTVWDFDEHFVAPRGGFADARDYYAKSSSIHTLDAIRVPTLAVQALDDPWIPARSYLGRIWPETAAVRPLLAPGGGHVGFHTVGSRETWYDRCIAHFLATLDECEPG